MYCVYLVANSSIFDVNIDNGIIEQWWAESSRWNLHLVQSILQRLLPSSYQLTFFERKTTLIFSFPEFSV